MERWNRGEKIAITFKSDLIPAIIRKEKVQTRRLVKEGEIHTTNLMPFSPQVVVYYNKDEDGMPGKIKWYDTQVHQVMVSTGKGRARKAVWYCPKCGYVTIVYDLGAPKKVRFGHTKCNTEYQKLRIKILGIRKEKLLDITENDAKKEGFGGDRVEFLEYVHKLYKISYSLNGPYLKEKSIFTEWNPDVWCLTFSVVRDN